MASISILAKHEKTSRSIAETVVHNLEDSNSWETSKQYAGILPEVNYWDDSLSERCEAALKNNSYVKTSYYAPFHIMHRINKFNNSGIPL